MKPLTPEISKILNELKPYKSMLVGGYVRDFLYNKEISDDVDIATSATPEIVIKKLTAAGMKVIPTGLKHGTVTCIYKKKPYEITTLRKDLQTNGRHADVSFTNDFYEDSLRRDFTFNAMYMDENGKVYDFHKGQEDLNNENIQFIGDIQRRITEDYLRILRYFRFHGKFETAPSFDDKTIQIIEKNVHHISSLSKERITSETFKMLKNNNTSNIWQKMDSIGIITAIGLDKPRIQNLNTLQQNSSFALSPIEKLICLHPHLQLNKTLFSLSNKDKKEIKDIQTSLKEFKEGGDVFQQGYTLGKYALLSALKILFASTNNLYFQKTFHELQNYTILIFPLSGEDLIKEGFKPSTHFGQTLKRIEHLWIKNNFPDKSWCIKQLHKIDK